MRPPWQIEPVIERYQRYAEDWRAKGRIKEAQAMENIIALLKAGKIHDPRVSQQEE